MYSDPSDLPVDVVEAVLCRYGLGRDGEIEPAAGTAAPKIGQAMVKAAVCPSPGGKQLASDA